ncbi:MAG: hypothetical protein AAB356_02365, partial [Deltaproteobacteria bacterium]
VGSTSAAAEATKRPGSRDRIVPAPRRSASGSTSGAACLAWSGFCASNSQAPYGRARASAHPRPDLQPYPCEFCGKTLSDARHVCAGMLDKIEYSCKRCGRLAIYDSLLCEPSPIDGD